MATTNAGERLAQAAREIPRLRTANERLRLADELLVDAWAIAEAASAALEGTPTLPPWERGRERDAEAHRELQRRLRELQGR